MKKISAVSLGLGATILVGAALGGPAYAQESDEGATQAPDVAADATADDSGDRNLDVVIVTAQRRAQSLQDVPITMSAVTAEQLEASGVTTTFDLPSVTPGLTLTTTRNGITPYLRGVGTQASTSEQAVAIYVDNVYIPSTFASMFSLNNIERVEVLKGPQGTLFGRNATGGLINVITRDPSHTQELDLSLGYGNYDTVTGNVYATTGLNDKVAVDIAGYVNHQGEGWGKNLFRGNDVNISQSYAVRSKLRADLDDSTYLVLTGDYNEISSDFGNARQTAVGTLAFDGEGPAGSIYDTDSNWPGGTANTTTGWGTSLKLNHDFSDTLSFTSLTAYRDAESPSTTDSDYRPVVRVDGSFNEVAQSFQQEFLLNGEAGKLEYTAGAFYFNYVRGMQPLAVVSIVPPINSWRTTEVESNSYAVFAQGTYPVGPKTNITAGLRYTDEDATVDGQIRSGDMNGPITFDTSTRTDGVSNTTNSSKMTWRLSVDHKLSDDVLLYASVNRGFKSGSYNAFAIADSPTRPETLDAYEVGMKSDLFGRTLRLNAAAFYYDYNDIQVSALAPSNSGIPSVGTLDVNAAAGRIKGIESDLVYRPELSTGNLELRASVSLLDTEYESFPGASAYIPNAIVDGVALSGAPLCSLVASGGDFSGTLTGGNTSCNLDASGRDMIKAPSFSSTLGANYVYPISDTMEMGFDVNWQHTGKFYWDPYNLFENPEYDLVNLQVSLGARDEGWRLRAWARNLTDTEYYYQVGPGSSGAGASAGAPFTAGIALDLKFGGN